MMRAVVLALGVSSVTLMAQTAPVQPLKEDAPPPSFAAPSAISPVPVSPGAAAGLLSQPVAPVYPPFVGAAHVQGTVVLRVTISREGQVKDLQVVSGPTMLVQAAEDAVRRWKYRPFLLNGVPTEVRTTINVNFTSTSPPKPAAPGTDSSQASPQPTSDGK